MAEIRTKLTADTSQFERAMKRSQRTANTTAKNTQSSFSKVASSLGTVASKAGAVGLAVGALATAFAALDGKNVDLAAKSFNDLANSFDYNGDRLLAKLQEVSHGMISDFDLMRAASRAMVLGLQPDAIVSYLEIAAASSKATGQTMTQAFDDITIGVARQSRMILDNLGIIVSVEKANEAYAKKLGVATSALTDNQKAIAFQNAVMEAGQRQIRILGSDTEAVFTNTAQLLTITKNLWNDLANAILGVVNKVSGFVLGIGDAINRVKSLWGTFKRDVPVSGGASLDLQQVSADVPKTDYTRTKQMQGNGVAATQRRAELEKKAAKELDKTYKEISAIIDKHTKTDSELIEQEYKERIKGAQGNADLIKKIEQAKYIELNQLRTEQDEQNAALLEEQRAELMSRRDQELEELTEWYEKVLEVDTMSNEQRIEAEQIYNERKQQLIDEANNLELQKARELADQQAQIEKEKADMQEKHHKIKMQGLMAFGDMALKHGGEIGEKIFMVTRGVAAAEAIVNTHAAVMKTMASVPYPLNVPLAAAQAAIGAAQVSSILSTSIGSSNVDSSVGGGGGSVPQTTPDTVTPMAPTAEQETKGSYIINIQGDIMNEDYVDLMAEKISEAVQDRNVILKASEARSVRQG